MVVRITPVSTSLSVDLSVIVNLLPHLLRLLRHPVATADATITEGGCTDDLRTRVCHHHLYPI